MTDLFSLKASGDPGPFDEDAQAVIACDGRGNGCVLFHVGAHLDVEFDAGMSLLDELGLDDAPAGLSVWTGKYVWTPGGYENPLDGSSVPVGKFRALVDAEWAAMRAGRNPFLKDSPP